MVPVLSKNKKPLMPCSFKRARILMERGEAKPYWCKTMFCIILQREPSSRKMQPICVGIDTGSKFEGLTVKTESKTLLNIQTLAKTDTKEKVEVRRNCRRARRARKTRYRKCRFNRKHSEGFIPPSTKARWDYKISLLNWLRKMYPITHIALEDICAQTKQGKRKWNLSFSPLQVGKNYFRKFVLGAGLVLEEFKGYENAEYRNSLGLKKNKDKSKKDFYTHCVDSWCLANQVVGGHIEPDNIVVSFLKPLVRHRRMLHVQNPSKGGYRKPYGGTRSLGFERGTLVKHIKYGLCLVGGTSNGRVSLHNKETNKRICQNAKIQDLKILTKLNFISSQH